MEVFLRTVLLGLVAGSIYALAATGLVLTYKTSGILNLGYGALALFTTFIHWQFTIQWGWPAWLSAVVVVLVIAPMIGVFLDTQLFRRLEGQPPIIGVIATVGLFVILLGAVFLIWGTETREVPSLFPKNNIAIPGGGTIGVDRLLILAVAATAAGGLAALLKFTRLGVAFRAVVDNRSVAGLMAINPGFVSATAWALGTSFAALTGVLLAPRLLLDPNLFPAFVIAFVLGAAMFGYLRSLPGAFAGGLVIGLIQTFLVQYGKFRLAPRLTNAIPFLLVTVLVLAAPRSLRRAGLGSSFVVRTRELAGHASARARVGAAVAVFAALAILPAMTGSSLWRGNMTTGLIQAPLFLSLVILTGYSGLISLGHTAFMGIASFSTAHFVADAGLSPWLAFALGALAAVPAGALIGIVAVRVHGLYLALMTLAFAFMAQEIFFREASVSGPEGVLPMPRPAGFTSDTAFYYLVLIILAAAVILAANLRSGRTGRILGALRDSETATRSLGINVVKYKVVIFSLSAFLAAVSGILASMYAGHVGRIDFIPFFSIFIVTIAVVGGIFHIGGAITAGILTAVYGVLQAGHPLLGELQLIFFGLGATFALVNNPEGAFGEIRRGGHAVLRLFARRRVKAEPLPVAGGQE